MSFNGKKGLVVNLSEPFLMTTLNYFYEKTTLEIRVYKNIYAILYYTAGILLCLSGICMDILLHTFRQIIAVSIQFGE